MFDASAPQQYTAPLSVRAQLLRMLAAISTTRSPAEIAGTSTGIASTVVLIVPHCQSLQSPQHRTAPPLSSAHACAYPTAICCTEVSPGITVGTAGLAAACPPGTPPQHRTNPSSPSAHTYPCPAPICTARVPVYRCVPPAIHGTPAPKHVTSPPTPALRRCSTHVEKMSLDTAAASVIAPIRVGGSAADGRVTATPPRRFAPQHHASPPRNVAHACVSSVVEWLSASWVTSFAQRPAAHA